MLSIDPLQEFDGLDHLLTKELAELKVGDEGQLRKPVQVCDEIFDGWLGIHY